MGGPPKMDSGSAHTLTRSPSDMAMGAGGSTPLHQSAIRPASSAPQSGVAVMSCAWNRTDPAPSRWSVTYSSPEQTAGIGPTLAASPRTTPNEVQARTPAVVRSCVANSVAPPAIGERRALTNSRPPASIAAPCTNSEYEG